jgi:hypothetical protein
MERIIDLPKRIAICLIGGNNIITEKQKKDLDGIEDHFDIEWYLRSDIYSGNYWTYSQIINESVISTESEFMIFVNPKTKTNKDDIIEIINDLCSGYCWVGLIAFGLWGTTKELFRHIGLMDERFIYSEYEDNDFSLRLKKFGKAIKWESRFDKYDKYIQKNRNKRLTYKIFNKKWPIIEQKNDCIKYAYLSLEEKKLPDFILKNKKEYISNSWINFNQSFINTDNWVANLLYKCEIINKKYSIKSFYSKSVIDVSYDGIKLNIQFRCNDFTTIQFTANSLESEGYQPLFGAYLYSMANNQMIEKNIKKINSPIELIIMHEDEVIYYNKIILLGFKEKLNIGLQIKDIIYEK